MMRFVTIIFIITPLFLYSQLTVVNPGLEGTAGDCFITPTPWANCMPYTNFITGNIDFTTPDTQPGCYNITLAPSEGDSYIGFGHIPDYVSLNSTVGATQWQEGFSQELSSPMVSNGCPYIFTIDLANGLTADPWNGTDIATTIGEVRVFGGFDTCSEEELLWTSGPITNENWETYTVEFTPSDNYSHILFQCLKTEVDALCAYILADNITTIINTPPVSYAGEDQEICNNFTNLNANNLQSGETGIWLIISGNAIFSNINDPESSVTNLNPGENIFEWVVSAECSNETGSSQVAINVVSPPNINAGEDQQVCLNSVTLNANTPSINESGIWNIISGNGNFINVNDPNTTVTNLSVGDNIFEWSITSDLCETIYDQINVNYIISLPISNAGQNQQLCNNFVTLNGNTPENNALGTWSFISGNGNIQDVNNPNTNVTDLLIGESVLQWSILDPCGTSSSEVIVNVEILEPIITNISNYNGFNISCNEESDGFIESNILGGYAPYNYNWIGPNNFNSISPNIYNLSPGLYQLTVIDSLQCENTISILLNAPEPIEIQLIGYNDMNCFNTPYIDFNATGGSGTLEGIINTSWGETTNFIWNTGDEWYFQYENYNQWDGEINVTATDVNNCSTTSENISITTWVDPIAEFNISTYDAGISDLIFFNDNSYSDAQIVNWEWDFGDGNSSNIQNPTHFYEYNNQYSICLTIEDENGCQDQTCQIINIYNNTHAYIPDIFTVNNDNINEVFLPIIYGIIENTYQMYIYDRWGKLLFQTNNHQQGWDGTYKNSIVNQDVYSYKIFYTTISGEEKTHIGKITLAK